MGLGYFTQETVNIFFHSNNVTYEDMHYCHLVDHEWLDLFCSNLPNIYEMLRGLDTKVQFIFPLGQIWALTLVTQAH